MVNKIVQVHQRRHSIQQINIKAHTSGYVHEGILFDNYNDTGERVAEEAVKDNIETK